MVRIMAAQCVFVNLDSVLSPAVDTLNVFPQRSPLQILGAEAVLLPYRFTAFFLVCFSIPSQGDKFCHSAFKLGCLARSAICYT